jgi:hypothetical protein
LTRYRQLNCQGRGPLAATVSKVEVEGHLTATGQDLIAVEVKCEAQDSQSIVERRRRQRD